MALSPRRKRQDWPFWGGDEFMTTPDQISQNIQAVQANIDSACERAGRVPTDVTLVAVSKQKPVADILAATEAGLRHFGENRIEEMQMKQEALSHQWDAPLIWHMIGAVPANKGRYLPRLFDVFEAVDSLKLAQKLSEIVVKGNLSPFPVFIEVNVSGEETKAGFNAVNWETEKTVFEQIADIIQQMSALSGLDVQGLMTLAPYVDDMDATRPVFRSLYRLRETLQDKLSIALPHLSMGMTNDYPVAIEEGATLVRVGRAIFGERQYG
jgi:pyridoxal phosphate enzyme (YggS family)